MSDAAGELGRALARVSEHPRWGAPGFERMLHLCGGVVQEPWFTGLEALRVTGSKGKGSVAAMAASILARLSVRCGVYTSPHVFHPSERIACGGTVIPDGELARLLNQVLGRAAEHHARNPGDPVTRFELLTAAALEFFAGEKPETVVAEAGIGGRFDPVRVLPGGVAALTSLEMEHAEVLGPTLDHIAYDKADLCPDGGTLVAGPLPSGPLRRLAAYCRVRGVKLVDVRDAFRVTSVRHHGLHLRFHLQGCGLDLPELAVRATGAHQAWNAAVAAALVTAWLDRAGKRVGTHELAAAVRAGLGELRLPGRFERVQAAPPVYMDVAHTPDSIGLLAETVRQALPGERLLLLTGASHDKNACEMIARLVPLAAHVVCTSAHHKGRPAEEIARMVRGTCSVPVEICEPIEAGMELAVRTARERGLTVLVGGGLFLAAEAATVLRGRDARVLWYG
jgi:dihydrofolate synthase/folylpolyglutamate synthase